MFRLVSAIHYGAALLDAQGRVIMVNDHLAQMCGIDPDAFRARPVNGLLTTLLSQTSPWTPTGRWPEDRKVLEEGPVRAVMGGNPDTGVSVSLVSGRGGRSVITFVPSVDRHRSGVLDALLRTTSAGVFILDADGRILSHNALARQLGSQNDGALSDEYPKMSSIDAHLTITQQGKPFSIVDQITRARRLNRDLTLSSDLKVYSGSESEFDVEMSIAPVDERGDSHDVVVLFIRDISDKKQFLRDVRRLQHAREVSRAAGGIAHELNNSATALITHLGLLERALERAPDAARGELKNAESAVRRITRLGHQLERFSGPRANWTDSDGSGTESVISAMVLTEIVQETAALAISGTGVRSSFSIDGGLPAVRVSAEAISQALFNVVINAVEAMDEEGLIHFSLRKSDDLEAVVVEVRDEGHGMDNRIVSQVTQPYFSTKPHAVGMGLTVTLSILENAGGGLSIETDPGFGTTVRLHLPVTEPMSEELSRGLSASDAIHDFHGFRVLLVEDDPLVRRSLERTLQSVGCTVTAVDSGDRAIEVFRGHLGGEEQFQLVMTDLTMPGRNDGVQLLRRIRELDPLIPAVLSSGALHRQNASSYRDAGFQYVLRKPFGESEVRFALSVALSR